MPAMTNTLKINMQTGLLEPITYRASAHHDERPLNMAIDMIVIHGISLPPGQFGTPDVEHFFTGQLDMSSHPDYASIAHLKVSSHLFIRRTGEIIQFVPFHKRAFHAGESQFQGRSRCNDFSIGIELEGTDVIPYEPAQYLQLSKVITLLKDAYPAITQERVVGHVDIAPGRKTDPGPAFNWNYLKGILV